MWSVVSQVAQYLWPIAITLFLIKLYQWWEFPHSRFPPGPRGLPYIGFPSNYKIGIQDIIKSEKTYGHILGGKLMGKNTVVLNKFEDIQDAFTKQGSVMSDRPQLHVFNDINQGLGLVVKNYNATCKVHRKFASSFFKGFFCSAMDVENICANESNHFIQHLMEQAPDMPIDLRPEFFNITVNVISCITLGHRFEYEDATLRKIVKSSTEVFGDSRDFKFMLFCLVFGACRHIPPFRYAYQRYLTLHKEVFDLIHQRIDEHKENFDPDNVNDFVDAFLKEKKFASSKNQPHYNDAELCGFVKELFFAGTETTSNTLAWAVAILLHNPECMEKMQKEIDSVLGLEEQLTLSHRDLMPFSCAIIHEVMRYRTLIKFGVPHATSKDVDFRQFRLPKNTLVSANLWAVHNNPELWDKPDKFNPHRHLDEGGNFVASRHVIPFGLGLRRCLGERIAKTEIFFFLVSLLRHFTLLPDPKAKKLPEIDSGVQFIVYSPYEYKILLQKRLQT